MYDNMRIKSGYDMEMLLGEEYLKTLICVVQENSNAIPVQLPGPRGKTLRILSCTGVEVLFGTNADFAITLPLETLRNPDSNPRGNLTIRYNVEYENNQFKATYVNLAQETEDYFTELATRENQPDWPAAIREYLRTHGDIAKHFPLPSNVAKAKIHKLDFWESNEPPFNVNTSNNDEETPSLNDQVLGYADRSGPFKRALGIYCNLDLKNSERHEEPAYVDPTTAESHLNGVSFLSESYSFAMGFTKDSLHRIANDVWHSMGRPNEEGKIYHPLENNGEYIGLCTSTYAGILGPQIANFVIRGETSKEGMPAEFVLNTHIKPLIKDGGVFIKKEIYDVDVETGVIGSLAGAISFGVLGGVAALFTGPAAFLVGAAAGLIATEIGEAAVESYIEDQAERRLDDQEDVEIPRYFSLFKDQTDPLYTHHQVVWNNYEKFFGEKDVAMSFYANCSPGELFKVEQEVTIDKVSRLDAEVTIKGISHIHYKNMKRPENNQERKLTIEELAGYMETGRVKKNIELVPTHIHSENTIVTHVKFDSGVVLSVEEAVALHKADVIKVMGYQLITPSDAAPHFRASADDSLDNNFESLPNFEV